MYLFSKVYYSGYGLKLRMLFVSKFGKLPMPVSSHKGFVDLVNAEFSKQWI